MWSFVCRSLPFSFLPAANIVMRRLMFDPGLTRIFLAPKRLVVDGVTLLSVETPEAGDSVVAGADSFADVDCVDDGRDGAEEEDVD